MRAQASPGEFALSAPAAAYALGMLTVVYSFNTLDRNLFGLMLPLIKADLSLTDTALGIVSGFAFASCYALAGVPIALLADRWNRRTLIAMGFGLFSSMTILTGMAQSALQIAAARFVLAIGEAAGPAPSHSMIADLFDKRRRPLALSLHASANSLGIMVGFPVLGWVAHYHGWRAAFLAAGSLGLAFAVVFRLTVKEPSRGGSPASMDANVRYDLASLLHSKLYLLVLGSAILRGCSVAAFQTWIPAFLSRTHHLDTQTVGTYMGIIVGPTGLAGALCGGLLTTRLARFRTSWLAWTPGLFILLLIPSDILFLCARTRTGWLTGMSLDTFLSAAQVGPVFALCLSAATPRTRALASSVVLLCMYLVGASLGPLVVGRISDAFAGTAGPAALQYALLTTLVPTALAGVLCLAAAWHVDGSVPR